jgi:hypothetical protein
MAGRNLYRRLVTWMRVVLPPSGAVGAFGLLYAAAETLHILLQRWAAGGVGQPATAAPRNGLVLLAAAIYASFRVLGFHPLARFDYGAWLFCTPWRHPRPLPFGPVHLTPQDLLVVGIGVLSCHGSPVCQCVLPTMFLLVYTSTLCLLLWYCGLRWWVYALVSGLGLVVWLSSWSLVAAWGVAVVLYPAAHVAGAVSLAGFPWTAQAVQTMAVLTGSRPSQRKQVWFDRSQLGWPFDLLQTPLDVPRRNWLHLAIETLLMFWVMYAGLSAIPGVADEVANSVFVPFGVMNFALVRLLAYCRYCRPPINLWGRIFTGRWIIPGYDQVFVGPLCIGLLSVLTLYGLRLLGSPGTVSVAASVASAVFAHRGIGPSLPRWLLTGNHRLVPGITNRREFEET